MLSALKLNCVSTHCNCFIFISRKHQLLFTQCVLNHTPHTAHSMAETLLIAKQLSSTKQAKLYIHSEQDNWPLLSICSDSTHAHFLFWWSRKHQFSSKTHGVLFTHCIAIINYCVVVLLVVIRQLIENESIKPLSFLKSSSPGLT